MTERPFKAVGILNGSGGLALGFEEAGFEVVDVMEYNDEYGMTFRKNRPSIPHHVSDPESWIDHAEKIVDGHGPTIDVVFGHPPCQGYSGTNAKASPDNPKNQMSLHLVRAAMVIRPRYVVFENIPRMLTMGRHVVDEVRAIARHHGYSFSFHKHDSQHFGNPQRRLRVIFVLQRRDSEFFWPSHVHRAPVDVWDAIGDLESVPTVDDREVLAPYVDEPSTLYQREMRRGCDGVYDHRGSELDARFGLVPQGSPWWSMPESAMTAKDRARVAAGKMFHSVEWTRLHAHRPSRVITGANNKIHPTLCRMISVREGARLMGFPDRWIWARDGFGQIAGGVSPQVAAWFADVIGAHLRGEEHQLPDGRLV